MLELLPGIQIETLPAVSKSVSVIQLGFFGNHVSKIPSSGEPFAMSVASHWCNQCGQETYPELLDDEETWNFFPCHLFECPDCGGLEEIASSCSDCSYFGRTVCSDCCSCLWCEACQEKTETLCEKCNACDFCCSCFYCVGGDHKEASSDFICGYCDSCEDHCQCEPDECSCSDCSSYRRGSSKASVPGWISRNEDLSSVVPGDSKELMRDHLLNVDPVQAMADFYLAEFLMQVGSDQIKRDAYRLQSVIVSLCDDAFRDYALLAIGGEIRHHYNVEEMPSGRATAWDYWLGMADVIGRAQILRDAKDLFDDGSWASGYGGKAWAICTDVAIAREEGKLNAKIFVDRVFSLQHNGGSFLNKSLWSQKTVDQWSVYNMQTIGNAHAARRIDFETLFCAASDDMVSLYRNLPKQALTPEEWADVITGLNARDRRETYAAWTKPVATYCVSPRSSDEISRDLAWEHRQMRDALSVLDERASYWAEIRRDSSGSVTRAWICSHIRDLARENNVSEALTFEILVRYGLT